MDEVRSNFYEVQPTNKSFRKLKLSICFNVYEIQINSTLTYLLLSVINRVVCLFGWLVSFFETRLFICVALVPVQEIAL